MQCSCLMAAAYFNRDHQMLKLSEFLPTILLQLADSGASQKLQAQQAQQKP